MVKPPSAMTSSPGTYLFQIPLSLNLYDEFVTGMPSIHSGNVHDESTRSNGNAVLYIKVLWDLEMLQDSPLDFRLLTFCTIVCKIQDVHGIWLALEARWHCLSLF